MDCPRVYWRRERQISLLKFETIYPLFKKSLTKLFLQSLIFQNLFKSITLFDFSSNIFVATSQTLHFGEWS
ncbi:unnamed protein product [Meloidogyne enterolobii]|uniref:Uncharacterized protein n=1 Tax=Meloidogyne enterolobii TaxID=390850 RepID=A0ACB0Y5Q4_MELEN